jgi:periplasmic divalent cation tolerance protein
MDDPVILYTTWPDAETAAATGRAAVQARLAACANILSPMRSIYRWQGALEEVVETPMLLKTTAALADALGALILARHPYDTPCILTLPTGGPGANPAYAAWVRESVGD